jgi:polyisoprenoid-binding protein YceI
MLSLGGLMIFNSACTKETEVEKIVYADPNDTLSAPSKIGIVNTMDGSWVFDKVHSNVNWETEYYGDQAFLTGKFNSFKIDINFDNTNFENTEINAWVVLSTFNTGEPGRDNPGKCGPGYVGVEYLDTLFTPDPLTDSAFFRSTSTRIELDKYVATGTFTFKGFTTNAELYYTFNGIEDYLDDDGLTFHKASFEGEFVFLALTDHGVTSTSIADEMYVIVNANFKPAN